MGDSVPQPVEPGNGMDLSGPGIPERERIAAGCGNMDRLRYL